MKVLHGATVLSLNLLLAAVPVYVASADDLTDADGLPVEAPITGQFTVPPLPKNLLLSQPGHEADILATPQAPMVLKFDRSTALLSYGSNF